ncbi:MAG: hypothetical protein KDD99_26035 [Bacteroidetes bacterium]|nr:hypothetical protein [Bacteroidota bacterium]
MSDPHLQKYWKDLRKAWKDTFVMDTIQRFDDLSYVLQIAKKAGFNREEILSAIDKLDNHKNEQQGWLIYDSICLGKIYGKILTSESGNVDLFG